MVMPCVLCWYLYRVQRVQRAQCSERYFQMVSWEKRWELLWLEWCEELSGRCLCSVLQVLPVISYQTPSCRHKVIIIHCWGGRIFQTCHNVTMHIHDWHWNIIAMIKESVALTSVRPNTQNRTAGDDWGVKWKQKQNFSSSQPSARPSSQLNSAQVREQGLFSDVLKLSDRKIHGFF